MKERGRRGVDVTEGVYNHQRTGWPVIQGRGFLVHCKKWRTLDKSLFTWYQNNTAMYNWSPIVTEKASKKQPGSYCEICQRGANNPPPKLIFMWNLSLSSFDLQQSYHSTPKTSNFKSQEVMGGGATPLNHLGGGDLSLPPPPTTHFWEFLFEF